MELTYSSIRERISTSWLVSLGLHALLVIILLFIKVMMLPEIPEYSEMDFVSVPTVTSPAQTRPPTVSSPTVEEQPLDNQDIVPENVALPEMKHLPQEQPELSERRVEKIAMNDEPFGGQFETSAPPQEDESYPSVQNVDPGAKPVAPAQSVMSGDRSQAGTGDDPDATRTRPYSIEGAASSRQVLTEVLPEYPPGLNKEAVIKIRFTVLPNGTIGEMIPLQKGDATLEEISLRAFQQWRFNSLPPDLPQDPHAGIITFRYILK